MWQKVFVVAQCNNSTIVNMKDNSTTVIMSWWCNLGNGDTEKQPNVFVVINSQQLSVHANILIFTVASAGQLTKCLLAVIVGLHSALQLKVVTDHFSHTQKLISFEKIPGAMNTFDHNEQVVEVPPNCQL